MTLRPFALSLLVLLLGCARKPEPPQPPLALEPLPGAVSPRAAAPTVDTRLGTVDAALPPTIVHGTPAAPGAAAAPEGSADIAFDFVDADLREVVAQILGSILHVTYLIDPAVHGTVTLRTPHKLTPAQVLPLLQAVLTQNGATLAQSGDLYRVAPVGGAQGAGTAQGSIAVPLRYAAAEDLARVLQPFVGPGGKLAADPGRNSVLIASDGDTAEALVALVKSFDVDILAGQSYALFPVAAGGVKDFTSALQEAFRSGTNAALAGLIRVVPMERVNAVLVVSAQPRYIEEARRVYALVDRVRRETVRAWHIVYLQNSDANDVAYVMQSALTPNNVTAQPRPAGNDSVSHGIGGLAAPPNGSGLSSLATPGSAGGPGASAAPAQNLSIMPSPAGTVGPGGATGTAGANPLLGGLDTSGQSPGGVAPDALRIVPDGRNNALLFFATLQEQDAIDAMLRRIDVLPRQVRIDATIAEVTLNDQLQYGTQFFFRSGGINGILSTAAQQMTSPQQIALNTTFPGFFIGGNGLGGAPFAINALQAVTTVQVLSSPQLLVLDNQPARLQVGNLVPYLSQTAVSTITSNAPVINSINYQQTGVILQVRPRVNSGGLVTLDIAQEVSDVSTVTPTNGINSPTFLERNVTSRVVVQDGQTVGLAGLITDNASRGNQGLPWLKDVPLLGLLAGTQDNARTRTELLILITPHVVQDQRDARALTEDMREHLMDAALVPQRLRSATPTGADDPSAALRRKLNLQP